MKSIRNQLLLVLFIVLTLAWVLVIVITYLESQHEVKEVFDSQMAQSAAVLSQISSFNLIDKSKNDRSLKKEFYGHRYEKKLAFQIWEKGQLILRSANAPSIPLATISGYSDQLIENEKWRVFSLHITSDKTIYTAEKHEVREELIDEITQQALYPLTIALPILMLLIWISLGQALKPLRKLAIEIEQRSSHNLEPVSDKTDIPKEIYPIISALNNLFVQVESAFEREKRFTSDASHELRTPLASIKIQTQVAMRAENEHQRQHALKQITQSVDRTTHLVEQMLIMARLEPGVTEIEFSFVNLSQLVRNVLEEYEAQAQIKHIKLEFINANNDVLIKGHDVALTTMLRNLIDNAINYSSGKSQVLIKTYEKDGSARLEVIDEGVGIPAEEREIVFSRFHRGADTQQYPGSGLGLSIVKRIIELHNAFIEISDNPSGKGTCVTVIFQNDIYHVSK